MSRCMVNTCFDRFFSFDRSGLSTRFLGYQSLTQTKSDGGRGLDPWGREPPPTDSEKAQNADTNGT